MRIGRIGGGRDLGVQRCHSSGLRGVKLALFLVVVVQLGSDSHVGKNQLELASADLSDHLVHHVVKLRCFHGLKYLIFHKACRFPKTSWYARLNHAVSVQAQASYVKVFQQLDSVARCSKQHPDLTSLYSTFTIDLSSIYLGL